VEGGDGGLTVSGVSRNRGGFVECVAIQIRWGIPAINVWVLLLILIEVIIYKTRYNTDVLRFGLPLMVILVLRFSRLEFNENFGFRV
jgi:hypothetical protein